MRDRIVHYARRLEGLSTAELSRGAKKLVAIERRRTAALIAHLAEISRRKGHVELGYKNLVDYCAIRLRLGKGSVWSRTQVANVSRRFPQVLEYLVEGKLSLSSLGVLAAHLNEKNVETLLAQAEGKTKEEVKEIVAAIRPKPAAEPMIRTRSRPPRIRLRKAAGAKKREGHEESRHIPNSVRQRLLGPVVYQCEYRGPDGMRCMARAQLDHIDPLVKVESCGEEDLRVMCRGHNLLCAARGSGEKFTTGNIERRKTKRSSSGVRRRRQTLALASA